MPASPSELIWIEDLLPRGNYLRRPMFGGFGYYIDDRMILAVFESEGDRSHKGKKYDFEIWHGCLFPIEREHHKKVLAQFPFLVPHPVLTKWLYLPIKTEDFDDLVTMTIKNVLKPGSVWGVIKSSKNKSRAKKKQTLIIDEKIDTRRPKMFSDQPLDFKKAKKFSKISDFKNLGPQSEIHFQKAGIKSPDHFIKLGWKKAFAKLAQSDKKLAHTLYGYALIGALKNTEWLAISDEDKAEAKALSKTLRDQIKTKQKTKVKKPKLKAPKRKLKK